MSLPLQAEPFSARRTRNFFEGLLPEGFTRHSVAQWMHTDEGDYPAILAELGKECLGAIQVLEDDVRAETPSYESLSLDEVKALTREGAEKSTDMVVKSHLSLAGASGKVGLYWSDERHQWYLPQGKCPAHTS